jgi:hypothetical protein
MHRLTLLDLFDVHRGHHRRHRLESMWCTYTLQYMMASSGTNKLKCTKHIASINPCSYS